MTRIKRILFTAMASFGLIIPMATPALVGAQADIQGGLCAGANLEVGADCRDSGATDETVNNILATVINIISLVVGVIAVIMIIIGGIKYITSGGDSGNVTGAKNTILYAVIGLVIVALAQLIVNFVLNTAGDL
jgi:hypothetical protein